MLEGNRFSVATVFTPTAATTHENVLVNNTDTSGRVAVKSIYIKCNTNVSLELRWNNDAKTDATRLKKILAADGEWQFYMGEEGATGPAGYDLNYEVAGHATTPTEIEVIVIGEIRRVK